MSQTTLERVGKSGLTAATPADISLGYLLPSSASSQLTRMFRDPHVLEKVERVELIQELRTAVEAEPAVSEVRIVLGMALCVNFEAQPALEEFRRAVLLDPDSFIARLKYGEILMRLRICSRAADETHIAAKLAATPLQSELARRQAATIRTMLREGVERGGFTTPLGRLTRLFTRKKDSSRQVTLLTR